MILKKRKVSNFTQIDNDVAQNAGLSFKARGILLYLLSKPDDWEVAMSDVVNNSPREGISSVRTGLEELIHHDFAALVVVRDKDSGQMMGTRYVVSDDKEWIQTVKGVRVLEVSARVEDRYTLRFDEDRDAENPEVGKIPRSGKSDPTNKDILKNTDSKSHSLTSETAVWSDTDWQWKAVKWWFDFLVADHRLPPTLLRRKSEGQLLQEWADVIDKLNRIDGYEPARISKILAWLKRTKEVEGQGKFWMEDAKLTSLAGVRKPSKSNQDYTKFDMIATSYDRHNQEKTQVTNKKPIRG